MSLRIKSISSDSHKGHRNYQEDRLFTSTMEQGTLLAVMDGHGGEKTSQAVSEMLPSLFADEIGEEGAINYPDRVIREVISKINAQTRTYEEGSTLSLVFIPAPFNGTVWCAVMGDSPIIIKTRDGIMHVGPDHNVRTNALEAEAAVLRGGIVHGGYLYDGARRQGTVIVGPGLQMARALGDGLLDNVLSRAPEIYNIHVNADSFIIVGSDGAFDPGHAPLEQVAKPIYELVERGQEAKEIVHRAAVDYPTGDNVACIVVRFEDAE